jgi:hypothetical protein
MRPQPLREACGEGRFGGSSGQQESGASALSEGAHDLQEPLLGPIPFPGGRCRG